MKQREEIAKAVIQVMKAVKGMEKNSTVGTGQSKYNGTKDQDVKEVFNDALAANGLCMVPIDIKEETKIDRWEEEQTWNGKTSIKQKQSVFTKVVTTYLLLHESGQSIKVKGYGHGVDPQDKGAGKATTYAMKNALLYTFMTPVGKIEDTETDHSKDIAVPVLAPLPAPKALTQPQYAKAMSASIEGITATLNAKSISLTNEQRYNLEAQRNMIQTQMES